MCPSLQQKQQGQISLGYRMFAFGCVYVNGILCLVMRVLSKTLAHDYWWFFTLYKKAYNINNTNGVRRRWKEMLLLLRWRD